jgi:hypothetical protein
VPVASRTYDTDGIRHVALRVTDSNGASADTTRDVTVSAAPAPPLRAAARPVVGQTVSATPVSGTVLVREPGSGAYVALTEAKLLAVGTQVDVRKGRIRLNASDGVGPTDETGTFYGGVFQIRQRATRFAPAELVLIDRGAPAPPAPIQPTAAGTGTGGAHAARTRGAHVTVRRLWGVARGNFRTRGRYASATVRGTQWLTQDLRTGTKVHVRRGSVVVRDFVRHKTVVVRAPKSYLAQRRLPRAKP